MMLGFTLFMRLILGIGILSVAGTEGATGVPDISLNLRAGTVSQNPQSAGIVWVHRPSTPADMRGTCGCYTRAVFRLKFDKVNRQRAEFKMTLDNPEGWSFNIGDKDTTNGLGGDGEVYGLGSDVEIWGRRIAYRVALGRLYKATGFLNGSTQVTVSVQDQLVTVETQNGFIYVNSNKTMNVDNYVYVAVNQVVNIYNFAMDRVGSGLCDLKFWWHREKLE